MEQWGQCLGFESESQLSIHSIRVRFGRRCAVQKKCVDTTAHLWDVSVGGGWTLLAPQRFCKYRAKLTSQRKATSVTDRPCQVPKLPLYMELRRKKIKNICSPPTATTTLNGTQCLKISHRFLCRAL